MSKKEKKENIFKDDLTYTEAEMYCKAYSSISESINFNVDDAETFTD